MRTKALSAPILLLSCLALFFFPSPLSAGLSTGLDRLISVALPALFPYMVITALMRSSGCIDPLARLASPLFTRLFGVGKNGVLPFLTALFAGYPIGASVISALTLEGKLSEEEANRLLLFCANPSPAFLIAGVGIGLFRHAAAGLLLYGALTLSSLLLGILQNLFSSPVKIIAPPPSQAAEAPSFFRALVSAVRESVVSMAYIGGFLLFFSALSPLLSALPLPPPLSAFFSGLLEVTGGVFSLPSAPSALPAAAFLCGFGGLCVTAQSAVFIEAASLSLGRYCLGRLFIALLASLLTLLFLKIPT